jgi:hypothetical protein
MADYAVKLVLLGIKKRLGAEVHRKAAMTPERLMRLRGMWPMEDSDFIVMWAVTLTAFFGLLRISNVLSPSKLGFVLGKHLARQDFREESNGFVVTLFWAKNNQFRDRAPQVPLPCIPGHPLCPVAAVRRAFQATKGADPAGPAFVRKAVKGFTPVLYGWYSERFLQGVVDIGLERSEYGTHSLRRGGATWALKCGLSSDVIKKLGDWNSSAYQIYLEVALEDKQRYMSVFAKHIRTFM